MTKRRSEGFEILIELIVCQFRDLKGVTEQTTLSDRLKDRKRLIFLFLLQHLDERSNLADDANRICPLCLDQRLNVFEQFEFFDTFLDLLDVITRVQTLLGRRR